MGMSLSLVVYQQRALLLKNIIVIIGTCLCGEFLAFFGTSALGKLFVLPSELVRPAVVRYFSVPLAIQSATALAASDAIAASFAVISGLLGATLGWPLVRKTCRVQNPSIMGTSIGGSSHGQGTAMLAACSPE